MQVQAAEAAAAQPVPKSVAESAAAHELAALADRYYEAQARFEPLNATFMATTALTTCCR
ncbi:hypothetical protein LP420_32335 [Massilia sp. B-10]|nr:hypothetical protein LP420_32335 [Massilia sp. B-10]